MVDKLLSSKGVKKFLAWGIALSLLLLLFSLGYPAAKRADRINQVASDALAATESLSTSITYFAGGDLAVVRQDPKVDDTYRRLCGLLTRVKESYGYERMYVVSKGVGNRFVYLLDAGYRDNATAGVDYALPGSEFKGAVQSRIKSGLEKMLAGKDPSLYVKEIITTDDHRSIIVSLVPLRDDAGQIIAALVVESPAGNTDFAKLGIVDFSLLALISGIVFLVLLLVLLVLRSWRKSRDAKRAGKPDDVIEPVIPEPTLAVPLELPSPTEPPVEPEETTPSADLPLDPHLPDDEQ